MTTTVTVRTRAWGASVKMTGESGETSFEVQPQSSTDLQVSGTATIVVTENPPATGEATTENARPFEGEPVPGRAENDKLLGKSAGASKPVTEPAT